MPPKTGPSKKTVEKAKAKIVEDKTFGLKNKKGAKTQAFVKQVQNQVHQRPKTATTKAEDVAKKAEADKLLTQLFKPVVEQKIDKGADPKTVLCAFFAKNQCGKGDKCKFSHDLSLQRKSAKINIFADARDTKAEGEDSMENWDQAKLETVVSQKHGAEAKNQTDIICKYFIEAIEKKLYGWFWVCPNGGDACKYRHALPPGYVLPSEAKKMKEDKMEISIEELVETERAALGSNTTKVTFETFMEWKKKKIEERRIALEKDQANKKKNLKEGKTQTLSGREVFMFNPDLVGQDDEGAADNADYERAPSEHGDDEDQVAKPLYDLSLQGGDEATASSAANVDVDEDLFGEDEFDNEEEDDDEQEEAEDDAAEEEEEN